MAETFQNILTIIGQQKKAAAEAGSVAVNITHFKVGDSNGTYYTPLETQTDLIHTTYTGSFTDNSGSQIIVNPSALNEVLYKCFIPADVGGFTVRELGLFDDTNSLILICKLPAQDKFALDSGLFQPLTFTPKIIYTNPLTQAVLTPSSQIIATKTFVTEQITQINEQLVLKSDVGHIHDDRYYTESETANIIERLFPLYAKPLTVLNGNTNPSTGLPNIINKISDTEVSFLVGGIYKNLVITDSKCKKYEISSIANVILPTDAGTYKFLIDFADITLQEDGTYHAIVNAVKLSYYYNGLIPAISMTANGYALLYNGSQGWNPYNLVNGLNTGVYMYGGGVGCGNAYTYDHSLIGNVIAIDSANNKITFAGEHVSTLYGTNQVLLDNSGSPGAVSYTFSNPVYENNTTTITLTGYYYGGWDGSGSNYNLYYAGLSAGYVTSALFLNKPVYTKALSTFIFNVPYLSLANSFIIQNADSAGAQVAISISNDGGNTYQTHSIVTLSTGLNTITINQNFNSIKFSFIPRAWYWDDGGGQYWIHHEYRMINISNININMTVSFAGGAVTQDYVYPTSPIDGDYFTLINQIPYICSKWINNTRVDGRDYVLLGEANRQTSNGVLGTPRSYAFNRQYRSALVSLPVLAATTTFNHNLGTSNIKSQLYFVCITAEQGYAVNDIIKASCSGSSNYASEFNYLTSNNAVNIATGGYVTGYTAINTNGQAFNLTRANWKQFLTAEANW